MGKHQTVPWTIHGLKGESVLVNVKGEHVLTVMLPVSRSLPELAAVHVGGQDLREVALVVLLSYEVYQCVINAGSSRKKETASGAQIMEKEKLLFLPNRPVVPGPGLLLELLPGSHPLLIRKGHPVDPLQHFHLRVVRPVCQGILENFYDLNSSSVSYVRPFTKLN